MSVIESEVGNFLQQERLPPEQPTAGLIRYLRTHDRIYAYGKEQYCFAHKFTGIVCPWCAMH